MEATDLDRFSLVMANPKAMDTFDFCRPLTSDETASHLQRWVAHHEEYGYSPGIIEHIETGDTIGFGGIACYPNPKPGGPELIYALLPHWWRQGLGSEFAQSAMEYGFQKLGLPRIFATVLPENVPSIRILDRIGMTRVGYLEESNRWFYTMGAPESEPVL